MYRKSRGGVDLVPALPLRRITVIEIHNDLKGFLHLSASIIIAHLSGIYFGVKRDTFHICAAFTNSKYDLAYLIRYPAAFCNALCIVL